MQNSEVQTLNGAQIDGLPQDQNGKPVFKLDNIKPWFKPDGDQKSKNGKEEFLEEFGKPQYMKPEFSRQPKYGIDKKRV